MFLKDVDSHLITRKLFVESAKNSVRVTATRESFIFGTTVSLFVKYFSDVAR